MSNYFIDEISSSKNKKLYNNKNNSNFNKTHSPFICQCGRENISYYCRNCQEYFCEKDKNFHNNHLTIKIDISNLEQSINLYAILVQTDIEQKIISNTNYINSYKINKYIIDIEEKQKNIINKLNMLSNLYINLMNNLQNEFNKDKEGVEMILKDFNLSSKIIGGELNNIMNEINIKYRNNNRINLENFKKYFKLISYKETQLFNLSQNIIQYKINKDINEKINRFYGKFEKNLDEFINVQAPFELDRYSLEYLIKIKKIDNNEINFNNKIVNKNANNFDINLNSKDNQSIKSTSSKNNSEKDKNINNKSMSNNSNNNSINKINNNDLTLNYLEEEEKASKIHSNMENNSIKDNKEEIKTNNNKDNKSDSQSQKSNKSKNNNNN
jgi:hypothetical protein